MHLRPPGRIDAALAEVNQLQGRWEGSWSSTDWLRVKDECLGRVDHTYDRLREHFDGQVAEVVYTRRYWEIHRLTSESQRPWDLFRREARAQADYLAKLAEELRAHRAFAARPGHIVVPDTSAFTRAQPFEQFNWPVELDLRPDVRLVVPILVIEELDKVKSFDRARTGTAPVERSRSWTIALDLTLSGPPGCVTTSPSRSWSTTTGTSACRSTTRKSSTKRARSRIGQERR